MEVKTKQSIIHSYRQIIAEGKVLEEDSAIIKSRTPSLTPLMKEVFNGIKAQDIREHCGGPEKWQKN